MEKRQPVRETRGFSRAQTGDIVTAALPMTWSLTMLAHACTHSANFDENTSGCVFTMHVIAYQWGWNYYFPREIISLFTLMPKKVGHGGIDLSAVSLQASDRRAGGQWSNGVTKLTSGFKGANKQGKNVAPNAISFFLKPGFSTGLSELGLPPFLATSLAANADWFRSPSSSRRHLIGNLDRATSRLVELFDEAGILAGAGFAQCSARSTPTTAAIGGLLSGACKNDSNSGLWLETGSSAHPVGAARPSLPRWAGSPSEAYLETLWVSSGVSELSLRHHRDSGLKNKPAMAFSRGRLWGIHSGVNSYWLSMLGQGNRVATAQHGLSTAVSELSLSRAPAGLSALARPLESATVGNMPISANNVVTNP
jgi:hypothetical protein